MGEMVMKEKQKKQEVSRDWRKLRKEKRLKRPLNKKK